MSNEFLNFRYLRRIRRNFEAETELMKDVPGWEVGKWYNEPVYKTVPQGMWIGTSKACSRVIRVLE